MEQFGANIPGVRRKSGQGQDLPPPRCEMRTRNSKSHRCPHCGRQAARIGTASRTLHDLGDPQTGHPIDLHVTYSKHRCPHCKRCFNADLSDLALPKCHYTHRAQQAAIRLVLEAGLPYRAASERLWREHHVLIPWATIQNWVEAHGCN
jgi:hypothetical protein